MDDLITNGAMSAFADVLRPTGAADTLARVSAAARRHSDETPEQLALGSGDFAPTEPVSYRGNLDTPAKLRTYVLGGKGRLTLVSRRTGARFTFKLGKAKVQADDDCRIFVRLLRGPDNGSDYVYLGTLWTETTTYRGRKYPPSYRHGRRSKVRETAPSAQAAGWLFARVARGNDEHLAALLEQAEVWHEGVCGRCGRSLTVPESIDTGLGPVCAGKES